jgi:hypothetical protein
MGKVDNEPCKMAPAQLMKRAVCTPEGSSPIQILSSNGIRKILGVILNTSTAVVGT